MLRSFRFANHRSFRDEHELLLLSAYNKDREAVPVTALYGANASGKSTVVDALRFMHQAVTDSYPRWEPDEGVPRTPFKLDPRCRNDPSVYVADVVVGGCGTSTGSPSTMSVCVRNGSTPTRTAGAGCCSTGTATP